MATKKVYRRGKQIISLDEIMNDRHKNTVIYLLIYPNSVSIPVSYNRLKVMSLYSIINLIEANNLFYATVIEEQIIRKTRTKVIPKNKSNINGCKASLDDIYRNNGESSRLNSSTCNDECNDSNR